MNNAKKIKKLKEKFQGEKRLLRCSNFKLIQISLFQNLNLQ